MSSPAYLVTGGTGGLGRAVVLHLLGAGARISVAYRDRTAWDALRGAAGAGAELSGESADLADPAAARRVVDGAAERLGGLDGVAALVGAYRGSGPLEVTPESEWDEMLRTNLQATYTTCRAALPHLLRHGGSVVTVGSRTMETGGPGAAAYSVAKAGVLALTRSLALENRDRGVRFNLVAPSVIDTAANRRAMPDADHSRWVTPERIAGVVAFLLSPASAPVTGALVPVYGRA